MLSDTAIDELRRKPESEDHEPEIRCPPPLILFAISLDVSDILRFLGTTCERRYERELAA